MLAAEDARGRGEEGVAPLRAGRRSADPELRAWAVRALGRLETDSHLPDILGLLADQSAEVRAEAANAAAQAVVRGDPRRARDALLDRARREADPAVLGVIAGSLGRLRADDSTAVHQTAETLLGLSRVTAEGATQDAPPEQVLGTVRGLFFLARQPGARDALPDNVASRLAELTAYGREAAEGGVRDDPDSVVLVAARSRRLATAALIAAGATAAQLASVLDDPDPYVRREAAAGAGVLDDRAAARRLAEQALDDAAGVVRYDGLRILGRLADDAEACERMRVTARDTVAHVALLAIDLLGTRCAIRPGVAQLLDGQAGLLTATAPGTDTTVSGADWHHAAHAIVALAEADPARARRRLPAFVAHDNFFVRTYAARAASALGDERTLRQLAADAHPNVRTEAVGGLRAHVGHGADDVYITQLEEEDSQLLQAAARALEGSSHPDAAAALLDALDRVTTAQHETSRDARHALLERIAELGRPALADRLTPYLLDFDAVIAAEAADVLASWTGTRPEIDPVAPPPLPLPSIDELNELATTSATLEMDGGTIALKLLPFVAPTNVARFVRLAREGYYDGLTFHRIAPNFVVQGGSPHANEYAGDGPYTRDELGLTGNWRGTVGLSTRGRDTGDAQLYINLVDNVRLDHDYTVWAEVVAGMDVVDRMLEGAVIRRVTIR